MAAVTGEFNGGAFGTKQQQLQVFPNLVYVVPADLSNCDFVYDWRPEVYHGASEQLPEAGSSSNLQLDLGQLNPLLELGDLDVGLDPSLVAELMTVNEPANAPVHPPRPVLPPSKDVGVTYHKKNKQWEAHLWVKDRPLEKRKKKGSQIFLGNFETRDEAKAAHDLAAIKLDIRENAKGKPYSLNFPESAHSRYLEEHADWTPRDFVWKIRRFSHKFSKGRSSMKGVSVRTRKRKTVIYYEAKISHTTNDGEKRTFDLGKYSCDEDAGRAYDRALLFLNGGDSLCVTNFRPSEYSIAEIEEAGQRFFASAVS